MQASFQDWFIQSVDFQANALGMCSESSNITHSYNYDIF